MTSPSRLTVVTYDFPPINPANSNSDRKIKLWITNKGAQQADVPIVTMGSALLYPVTSDRIGEEVKPCMKAAIPYALSLVRKERSPSQIDPGQVSIIDQVTRAMTAPEIKMAADGKAVSALFAIMTWQDDALPSGHFWVTEWIGTNPTPTSVEVLYSRTYQRGPVVSSELGAAPARCGMAPVEYP